MNPNLKNLHPYPFEKLAQLKNGITPPVNKSPITLSIGEPAHATPQFIKDVLIENLNSISNYPTTKGIPKLREAIADWLGKRFACDVNPETQVLPVNGTREALFSFAQCVIDATKNPLVVMPNPFYQIYEGAALLAGAEPYFLNTTAETNYLPDFAAVPADVWERCQLLYICSPANPSGSVMSEVDFETVLELAEKYDFIIASDECYSELYDDEANPPVGLLEVAAKMGNSEFKRCVVFHSLSKRSNCAGLRSGFVAGDAEILKSYFAYRTYHGCAMSVPTQYASIAAWQDEAHVVENRRLYREKFAAFVEILSDVCTIQKPPASFYIWLKTSISDTDFTQQLFAQENVTVLAGSFLSREFAGVNPAANHVRIALVAPLAECIEAAKRIKNFINNLQK
ncbi:MAG: succinyldiaminopimelate transaminase [Methylococcaceae bacterium]|jgi:N-succinyldiaminopimelate aminotransferase